MRRGFVPPSASRRGDHRTRYRIRRERSTPGGECWHTTGRADRTAAQRCRAMLRPKWGRSGRTERDERTVGPSASCRLSARRAKSYEQLRPTSTRRPDGPHPEPRSVRLLGAWAPRPAGERAAVEGAAAGVAVHVEAVEEVVQREAAHLALGDQPSGQPDVEPQEDERDEGAEGEQATCDPKRVQKTLAYPTLWNQCIGHRPMPNVRKPSATAARSGGPQPARSRAADVELGMSPFEPTIEVRAVGPTSSGRVLIFVVPIRSVSESVPSMSLVRPPLSPRSMSDRPPRRPIRQWDRLHFRLPARHSAALLGLSAAQLIHKVVEHVAHTPSLATRRNSWAAARTCRRTLSGES